MPGPPIVAAEAGPPAGNVPSVAGPSVCSAHAPGATSSSPTAALTATARRRADPTMARATVESVLPTTSTAGQSLELPRVVGQDGDLDHDAGRDGQRSEDAGRAADSDGVWEPA